MEGFFNFVPLEPKVRYTLGKKERLKSRKTIDHLFTSGRSFAIFPFRILYHYNAGDVAGSRNPPSHASSVQAGFTVSSRHFKRAVDRNRIKRLMRESWRLQKNDLAQLNNILQVFIIFTGKEMPVYAWIFEKTGLVIKQLIKLTIEKRQWLTNKNWQTF